MSEYYTLGQIHRGYKVFSQATWQEVPNVSVPPEPREFFTRLESPQILESAPVKDTLAVMQEWLLSHPGARFHELDDGRGGWVFGEYVSVPNPEFETQKKAYDDFYATYYVERNNTMMNGPAIELPKS